MEYVSWAKSYTLQFTIVSETKTKLQVKMSMQHLLGVNVRNMKLDFNIYGTWRRAMNTNDEYL